MQDMTIAAMGNLFLALSDPTRLRLLSLMAGREVSVGFLAETLGESQPKISRHLAYLRNAGLVLTRRDGKWIYYEIAPRLDPSVENVLYATLRSISGQDGSRQLPVENNQPHYDHADVSPDTSDETYMSEWQPAEIDVFLL
jgi:DNA-binding transcriptional ArsR family regulator